MKWKYYLSDHRLLLATFFIIMLFTSLIIWLDPNLQIHTGNLLYLLLVMGILFGIYMLVDYRKKQEFYRELKESTEAGASLKPMPSHKHEEKLAIELLAMQKQHFELEMDRLKKDQKEWHEYMTTWVHEIKTPISVSKMIFETEEGLESLEEEMERIEQFVDQALYYTRASDFSKDYFIQEQNVEQVIKDAIKGKRKLFLSKNIKLQLSLPPMEVLTDKKGLLFILNQILFNSLKYTSKGGEIAVHVNADERRITIRDTGIGIAAEDLPRIFEKGFTGKNGRQFTASTGMGLYLAKKIAGKLGHQLSIHSVEGSYTEVTIQFSRTVDMLRDEFYYFQP